MVNIFLPHAEMNKDLTKYKETSKVIYQTSYKFRMP